MAVAHKDSEQQVAKKQQQQTGTGEKQTVCETCEALTQRMLELSMAMACAMHRFLAATAAAKLKSVACSLCSSACCHTAEGGASVSCYVNASRSLLHPLASSAPF